MGEASAGAGLRSGRCELALALAELACVLCALQESLVELAMVLDAACAREAAAVIAAAARRSPA
jgi:hypothetical protein